MKVEYVIISLLIGASLALIGCEEGDGGLETCPQEEWGEYEADPARC